MFFSRKKWNVVNIHIFSENTMATMGHDGPLLPFGFKFSFQNKSIFIKSNLIIKLKIQIKQ